MLPIGNPNGSTDLTTDEHTRVLVAADNLLARVGLVALLETVERTGSAVDIVGQTLLDGDDSLLQTVDVYQPDAVAIDMGYEPVTLLPRLQALSEAQIPFVALLPDEAHVASIAAALVDSPAYGLLPRDGDPDTLASALVAVDAGLVVLDPAFAAALVPAASGVTLDLPVDSLTPREEDVLQLMAKGLTNKAIAQALNISPNTVKFHINAILGKLGAQSRTEAVVRATRLGLVIL